MAAFPKIAAANRLSAAIVTAAIARNPAARGIRLGVPRQAVTVSGETTVYTAPIDTGNTVSQHFCPTCGSPVFATNSAMADMMFLRASCLDDLENFQPGVVV